MVLLVMHLPATTRALLAVVRLVFLSPFLRPWIRTPAGLKKISGVFKKGLHLGRDSGGSVGSQVAEQPSPQPSGASPRVRFSMDDSRADS